MPYQRGGSESAATPTLSTGRSNATRQKDERRKVTINGFILWALESEIMSRHDPAVLIGLNDPTDRHLYDWKSVGIQRQMEGGQ